MSSQMLKIVFVDIRDTLGYVDRPGHLVLFKPTTMQFLKSLKNDMGLRIGAITNLPANVNHAQGVQMLRDAGITEDLIATDDVISSHEANTEKPSPSIYQFACNKLNINISEALFVGENLLEVIGAQAAGLNAMIKPFPPSRDFLLRPLAANPSSNTDSGRLSETLMEEEHMVGKRIVGASAKIAIRITENKPVSLTALGNLVYLLKNFVDPYHHMKEEKILLPFAVSRGYPAAKIQWVLLEHDQGRAYFTAIEIAYKRLLNGDAIALQDLKVNLEGFVNLYKQHGGREDNEFLPEVGKLFSDQDDALIIDLFSKAGPADLTPYLALIAQMESELEK
jgi:hemerythrin-like domain-containing protein/histidinol phosphatase-like enzyme